MDQENNSLYKNPPVHNIMLNYRDSQLTGKSFQNSAFQEPKLTQAAGFAGANVQ